MDGEKWFIVSLSDQAAIEEILDEYKQQYLQNVDQNAIVRGIPCPKIEFIGGSQSGRIGPVERLKKNLRRREEKK